jgi:hypothetical protein
MPNESAPALRPDFFGQLAATDPFQGRARRLFERGQVLAVNGNQADLLVGYDQHGNPLELKQVPIVSGYVPRVGDWAAIQYEAGHSGAPWVTGPSMTADVAQDSAGIGVFPVSSTAPTDPQRSTMYFDESLGTWRGWDGGEWVDAFGKLHNALPDLQGGAQGEYYHFSQEAHGALHALWDGEGMASSWIKRLNFRSVDASATQRTRLFEKDGDFFCSINAAYDEVSGQWNRIDTTKYAYLVELRSENGIPCEPIGGIVWWRAAPGSNPIGDYTAVGGWELGFMMTEHRNHVMGGMNLELDGSGSPPYGRLTQIGSNDASGTVVTAMQRNSWYEGSGSWARDSADRNSAIIGFDDNADLFVWWYPDSTEGNAPWSTLAWQHRLHFHLGGATRGRLDVTRASAETDAPGSAFLAKHKTSGDMADGFAAGYLFAIEGSAAVESIVAAVYGVRDGADNTGKLSWRVASGGSLDEYMSLTAGMLTVNGAVAISTDTEDVGISFTGTAATHHIYPATADGSDSHLVAILGGGARATSRGAYAFFSGNEYAANSRGRVALVAGVPGTAGTYDGHITLDTGGGVTVDIDDSQNTTLAGDLRVDGGDVGRTDDPDLLQLGANALTLNHAASGDVHGGLTIDNPNDTHYTFNDITLRHYTSGVGLENIARISSYRWSRTNPAAFASDALILQTYNRNTDTWNAEQLRLSGDGNAKFAGLVRAAIGSVSAPPYSFSGATAYGMYYYNSSLRWAINGGLKMMLDNSQLKAWGDIEATGNSNVAGHYEVDGTRVVTNRQPAISDLNEASPPGGSDLSETKACVNDILAALRAHGLIAS